MVLEKTLDSPLDGKEIQPVNPWKQCQGDEMLLALKMEGGYAPGTWKPLGSGKNEETDSP